MSAPRPRCREQLAHERCVNKRMHVVPTENLSGWAHLAADLATAQDVCPQNTRCMTPDRAMCAPPPSTQLHPTSPPLSSCLPPPPSSSSLVSFSLPPPPLSQTQHTLSSPYLLHPLSSCVPLPSPLPPIPSPLSPFPVPLSPLPPASSSTTFEPHHTNTVVYASYTAHNHLFFIYHRFLKVPQHSSANSWNICQISAHCRLYWRAHVLDGRCCLAGVVVVTSSRHFSSELTLGILESWNIAHRN